MSAPTLLLSDVKMVFGKGAAAVEALRGVNLSVADGEIVAIVGPSGSGKTTLLSVAGCLLRPTAGSVRLLDQETLGLSESRRAELRLRRIGFVFQAFNLLPALSAIENVQLVNSLAGANRREARARAEYLLGSLGLAHRASVRPGNLSGGEQQRLAVARALANRPDLILADEPTSSLDSQAGRQVMELMVGCIRQREARSLVVVTHDARILGLVDRVIELEDGRLGASAPPPARDSAPAA